MQARLLPKLGLLESLLSHHLRQPQGLHTGSRLLTYRSLELWLLEFGWPKGLPEGSVFRLLRFGWLKGLLEGSLMGLLEL